MDVVVCFVRRLPYYVLSGDSVNPPIVPSRDFEVLSVGSTDDELLRPVLPLPPNSVQSPSKYTMRRGHVVLSTRQLEKNRDSARFMARLFEESALPAGDTPTDHAIRRKSREYFTTFNSISLLQTQVNFMKNNDFDSDDD